MNKIWFISDTHFNHANIIKYCNRPFKDVDEMNQTIIHNWNSVVSDEATVFFLGDFVLGKYEDFANFTKMLKGHKHFIIGNHEHISKEKILLAGFESVYKKLLLKYEDKNLVLTHYPQEVENGEICIYGHVHDKPVQLKSKSFCVCAECIGYTPIEIDEILRRV